MNIKKWLSSSSFCVSQKAHHHDHFWILKKNLTGTCNRIENSIYSVKKMKKICKNRQQKKKKIHIY